MVIIETSVFTRQVQKLLSDDEYRQLQTTLTNRPAAGKIISKSGGVRKIRWGLQGRGKRGGARVIYYWAVQYDQLLMLLIYPKNIQDNLSPTQLKMLKQMVKAAFP